MVDWNDKGFLPLFRTGPRLPSQEMDGDKFPYMIFPCEVSVSLWSEGESMKDMVLATNSRVTRHGNIIGAKLLSRGEDDGAPPDLLDLERTLRMVFVVDLMGDYVEIDMFNQSGCSGSSEFFRYPRFGVVYLCDVDGRYILRCRKGDGTVDFFHFAPCIGA